MRKLLSLIMLLSFVVFVAAQEETRQTTFDIEGEKEHVIETKYVSEAGFLLWYQSQWLKIDESDDLVGRAGGISLIPLYAKEGEEPNIYMRLVPQNSSDIEESDFFNAMQSEYGFSELETMDDTLTEHGALIQSRYGEKDGQHFSFSIIKGTGVTLYVVEEYPTEALEGFAVRYYQAISSIEYIE